MEKDKEVGMKLEKAIEVTKSLLDGTYDHRDEVMEEALKLVIEAGKAVTLTRMPNNLFQIPLLPGEIAEE